MVTLTIVAEAVAEPGARAGAAAASADVARGEEPARPAPAKQTRILLVDDHPLNRRVGRLYLEPAGFYVAEAVNGQDALDHLAEDQFDLVLMDVHMPVMDGLEALRQIRRGQSAWRDIPVIAFTADAMSGDRERYIADGMNGFVPKPIEKRDLLAEISRILGRPADVSEERGSALPGNVPAVRQDRPSMQ